MQGTRTVGSRDPEVKGGSKLRSKVLLLGLVAAVVFGATAFGFDAYFADASGNKIEGIWEGARFFVVINDPEKGDCGIDEFTADLVIFDFKTGAYIEANNQVFREFTAGSGIYFWVDAANNKRAIKVGDRQWTTGGSIPQWTHILPASAGWKEGAWEYVDENVLAGATPPPPPPGPISVSTGVSALPEDQQVARVDLEGLSWTTNNDNIQTPQIQGRFENMDTLILIVADDTDERNID
ncbi:TPA: hypothetical protein EYH33_04995, partial [Candidatus Bipolaricaulota bacterium]|nr:hypothetical protein [Candidatus Bipolaricaulota bacterium]